MKKGVLIVNTSRGGLIQTDDLIEALESGHVQGAALDVVEGEKEVYFRNHGSIDAIPNDRVTLSTLKIIAHTKYLGNSFRIKILI